MSYKPCSNYGLGIESHLLDSFIYMKQILNVPEDFEDYHNKTEDADFEVVSSQVNGKEPVYNQDQKLLEYELR